MLHEYDATRIPLVGAHMPTSAELEMVMDHIRSIGGAPLQLFTRYQRHWNKAGPVTE